MGFHSVTNDRRAAKLPGELVRVIRFPINQRGQIVQRPGPEVLPVLLISRGGAAVEHFGRAVARPDFQAMNRRAGPVRKQLEAAAEARVQIDHRFLRSEGE